MCLLAEAAWRLMRRRGLWLFGGLLMLDGVYLAAAAYLTGGTSGSVRYLVLVHLGAVTLLASYRTGVKLALWHSLLQLCAFYASRAGILQGQGRGPVGSASPLHLRAVDADADHCDAGRRQRAGAAPPALRARAAGTNGTLARGRE